jgi:uncharacterized membrane protein
MSGGEWGNQFDTMFRIIVFIVAGIVLAVIAASLFGAWIFG